MVKFVEDHFTRVADAVLSAHVPDTIGDSWVEEINTSGQAVNVVASNDNLDLTGTQAAVQIVYTARPAPSSADYSAELTTTTVPSDSDDPHGLVVRYSAGDMYFAALYRASNSNDKRIYKVVSGVRTLVAQSDSGLVDGDKARLTANGTSLDLDEHTGIDWAPVISTSDSEIAAAGFVGLGWGNIGVGTEDVNNITKIDDFIAQTLAAAGQTLIATGKPSSIAFGNATVAPGSVALAATGKPSSTAFGAPAISIGALTLSPTGKPSAAVFGVPVLTPGAVLLQALGLPSGIAFGAPIVSAGPVNLTPTGKPSSAAYGGPVITSGNSIAATGKGSSIAFGTPILTPGAVTLSVTGLASAAAFGLPALSTTFDLFAGGLPSTVAFGNATIQPGPVSLQPVGLPSGAKFGAPTIVNVGDAVIVQDTDLAGTFILDRVLKGQAQVSQE